jgi:hypothetical protein
MTAIASLFTPKSTPPRIEIDIMKPFEDEALHRQHKNWYDVELSEVTLGQIKYKI